MTTTRPAAADAGPPSCLCNDYCSIGACVKSSGGCYLECALTVTDGGGVPCNDAGSAMYLDLGCTDQPADSGPVGSPDAGPIGSSADAGTDSSSSGGCAVAATAPDLGWFALALLALLGRRRAAAWQSRSSASGSHVDR